MITFKKPFLKNVLGAEECKAIKKIARRVIKDRNLAQKGVKIKDINTPIERERGGIA